jgi:hypothetical protein
MPLKSYAVEARHDAAVVRIFLSNGRFYDAFRLVQRALSTSTPLDHKYKVCFECALRVEYKRLFKEPLGVIPKRKVKCKFCDGFGKKEGGTRFGNLCYTACYPCIGSGWVEEEYYD